MQRVGSPETLFRRSFLNKGLVTFGECLEHYAVLDANALLDEMRLMLTAPMLAVPFAVASARYYALMDALIRCAGLNQALSEAQRVRLVGICVDIAMFLRGRTADERTESFETALSAALDAVRQQAVHPEIADEIRRALAPASPQSLMDFAPATAAAEMRALAFDEPPPALESALPA